MFLHTPDLAHAAKAIGNVAGTAQTAGSLHELRSEVRARVASDRDVIDVARVQTCLLQAPRRGKRRKASDMLHAAEPLLLRGGDERTVDHERCGGVTVEGVEAEDRRHGQSEPAESLLRASAAGSRSRAPAARPGAPPVRRAAQSGL